MRRWHAGSWLRERGVDLARWPANLGHEWTRRGRRLCQTVEDGALGLTRVGSRLTGNLRADGMRADMPAAAAPAALWILTFAMRVFDLIGGPEIAEVALHVLTRTTSLTPAEQDAGARVLGASALDWQAVRVAQGGVLKLAFHANGGRAFTLWHTVNLPLSGRHVRSNLGLVIHELVHVCQYERVGSAYITQALHAQQTAEGYDYGQAAGLAGDRLAGRRYCAYNREQQAQIVQDYYNLTSQPGGGDAAMLACYEACIAEMRAGEFDA